MSFQIPPVPCFYCSRPLELGHPGNYRRITGWERKIETRSTGTKGGSDISARERLDEWACPGCVEKLKAKINPLQQSFL